LYATGDPPDDDDIYDHCVVPGAVSLPNDKNGYGFFVYGDPEVANVDVTFTNPTSQNIERSGALRLVRSVGPWEQLLSYGSSLDAEHMTNFGFEFVNLTKSLFTKAPFHLVGEGSEYGDFVWEVGGEPYVMYSPGAENVGQSLAYNEVPLVIWITDIQIGTDVAVGFMSTDTNSAVHTLLSCTNLLVPQDWQALTNYPPPVDPYGTNWFAVPLPAGWECFYQVAVTNSP